MRIHTLAAAMGVFLAVWAGSAVTLVDREITFSPEQPERAAARIVVDSDTAEKNAYFLVRDEAGRLVACLCGPLAAGRNTLGWDGRDAAGAPVARGRYQLSTSPALAWQLDTAFGRDGRIGRFVLEAAIEDAAKAAYSIDGVVQRVTVNGERLYDAAFYRADEAWAAGRNYSVKDGVLTVNPQAGLHRGDRISIEYHYPVFLQNPWDLALDSQGNAWVLLQWQAADVPYILGRLLKILSTGKGVDERFGTRGFISGFNAASQVQLDEAEGHIYLGGSDVDSYATGVFALDTGARQYYLGGYFGNSPKTTGGLGICLGEANKLYLRVLGSTLIAYDRTKGTKSADDNGFLYSGSATGETVIYPALTGAYWGPSLAPSAAAHSFYLTAWGSTIYKIRDAGDRFTSLYSLQVPELDDPVGVSYAPEVGLLFAGLRTARGQVAIIADTGSSLKEVARLSDPALGGVHTVRWHRGYLYVLEDGEILPDGYTKPLTDTNRADVLRGRNRISRYAVGFTNETRLGIITRE